MALADQIFPDPGVSPGEYHLEWILPDRRVDGYVELAARRLTRLTAYGPLDSGVAEGGERVFPQIREMSRLVGRLRSNLDLVVTDAWLEEWFPERHLGAGTWAVVGLEIATVPGLPPPPDLNCADIPYRNFRVLWNVPDPDPHRFDGDHDGIGCET
jgi:hypothetical protein